MAHAGERETMAYLGKTAMASEDKDGERRARHDKGGNARDL